MIRKVLGEFDSLDLAEVAARRIKEDVSGINRIKIYPKSEFYDIRREQTAPVYGNFFNGENKAIPIFYPYAGGNAQIPMAMIKSDFKFENSIEAQEHTECVVEVHCKEQLMSEVSSKIISLGGLHITEV